MAEINQNDEFFAGNRRTLRFTITNDDLPDNPPFNLNGFEIKWALSRISSQTGLPGTTPILEKCLSQGEIRVVSSADNNICEVDLFKADTMDLNGEFYQELELFVSADVNSESVVLATGTLTINRNILNTC